jgi:molecular chaperone HtpG
LKAVQYWSNIVNRKVRPSRIIHGVVAMTQQDFQRQQQSQVTTQQFGIDIEKIVKMFSVFLYADSNVVIRELISNASDSCVQRKARDPECQLNNFRLIIDYCENGIIFQDTGAGMTREEIEKYLSTIGASGTETLRDSLRIHEKNGYAGELIGKFGLGFLSAFVVADRVEVETKSFQDNSPAYRWTCNGHEYYELEEAIDYKEIGTKIKLMLKPDCSRFLNSTELRQLILKYSGNLDLPIYFQAERINRLAPWYRKDWSKTPLVNECIEFLCSIDEIRFDGAKDALAVIPVCEPDLDLRGVLYIPSRFQRWVTDAEGIVDVYCNRVLVRRDDLTLVPDTVSIVRGWIDCSSFTLMMNRDGVIQDEVFRKVQKRIKNLVITCIKNLSQRRKDDESEAEFRLRRSNFEFLMELHGRTLMKGALDAVAQDHDEDYFLAIAENAIFKSNKSKNCKEHYTTLSQYVINARGNTANKSRSDNRDTLIIFYNKNVQGLRQLEEVLRVQEVEILDATDHLSLTFIETYARICSLEARPYEDLLEKHFTVVNPVGAWNEIIDFYSKLPHTNIEIEAKIAYFEPQNVPLLVVPDEGKGTNNQETKMLIEALKIVDTTSKAKLLDVLDNHGSKRTLYINNSNSLMREIKEYRESKSLDQETFHLVLHELFHNALTFANEPLDPNTLFEFHEKVVADLCKKSVQVTERSQKLISIGTQLADIQSERDNLLSQVTNIKRIGFDLGALNSQHNKVFVMRPYSEDSKARFKQCILACQEQGLQTVDLENRNDPGNILEEINKHIVECPILIGDMTDASPNVMYEIGAAHMLGKAKQTILIARETNLVPFNLKVFRIIPCGNDAQALSLRENISKALEEIKRTIDNSNLSS